MTITVGDFQFVLTRVADSDRCVVVVREVSSGSEACIDMTKAQASTLADAIKALSR